MEEKDRKDYIEDFKKAEGPKRLDMWDYAIEQQVLWENIITEMQNISREQGVDKKLEKMIEDDMNNLK